MKAGKTAAATVMPMLTAALYTAQFTAPYIISGMKYVSKAIGLGESSYVAAVIVAALLILWSIGLGREKPEKP